MALRPLASSKLCTRSCSNKHTHFQNMFARPPSRSSACLAPVRTSPRGCHHKFPISVIVAHHNARSILFPYFFSAHLSEIETPQQRSQLHCFLTRLRRCHKLSAEERSGSVPCVALDRRRSYNLSDPKTEPYAPTAGSCAACGTVQCGTERDLPEGARGGRQLRSTLA